MEYIPPAVNEKRPQNELQRIVVELDTWLEGKGPDPLYRTLASIQDEEAFIATKKQFETAYTGWGCWGL